MAIGTGENVVMDFGATKQAALFFDHVVPLDGVEGVSGVGSLLQEPEAKVEGPNGTFYFSDPISRMSAL